MGVMVFKINFQTSSKKVILYETRRKKRYIVIHVANLFYLLLSAFFFIIGTLLIDEMKLNETFSFDGSTLKINGFTDLGEYTPLHQKDEKGDHALVMMFQALACFLSKGCASATIIL